MLGMFRVVRGTASGVFQFNAAGVQTYAPTALGAGTLQQLMASGLVQITTTGGAAVRSTQRTTP